MVPAITSSSSPSSTEKEFRVDVSFPPLLLKVRDAARTLTLSERKLWALTNSGDVPCVRIGRAVRYSPADLVNWIDEKKNSSMN